MLLRRVREEKSVCVCVCEGFDYYVDVGNGVVFDWVLLLGQRERDVDVKKGWE